MQYGEHYVVTRGEPQQNQANQGPAAQIEGLGHFRAGKGVGLLCKICRRWHRRDAGRPLSKVGQGPVPDGS
jgi:hypothetical protein